MWRWPLAVPGLAEAPIRADALATETAWCFPLDTGNGAGVLAVGHRREERLPRELAELATEPGVPIAWPWTTPGWWASSVNVRPPAGLLPRGPGLWQVLPILAVARTRPN